MLLLSSAHASIIKQFGGSFWQFSCLHRVCFRHKTLIVLLPLLVKQSMHSSSLVNAAYIWGSETASVGELLKGDHPLAAMATLMFSPHKLQQVSVRCNVCLLTSRVQCFPWCGWYKQWILQFGIANMWKCVQFTKCFGKVWMLHDEYLERTLITHTSSYIQKAPKNPNIFIR